MNEEYRIEEDKLGKLKIENSKYWGIHTERAFHNFNISGLKIPVSIIRSFAMIKKHVRPQIMNSGIWKKKSLKPLILRAMKLYQGDLMINSLLMLCKEVQVHQLT